MSARNPRTVREWHKRIGRTRWIQAMVGEFGAYYLRLVWRTARFRIEPSDIYERLTPELPVIIAMWHGQHFMVPFLKLSHHRVKVLISRHHDGEVNAITAERLGVETIRGSGTHGGQQGHKGGATAFRAMLAALQEGYIMALTADVPKVSRVCGRGIVKLGRASGRPIYPVAVATSNRIELSNWDRSAVNLPFGRGAMVLGDPIRVPAGADDETLESCRRQIEQGLNKVTARAYAIVDGSGEDSVRG